MPKEALSQGGIPDDTDEEASQDARQVVALDPHLFFKGPIPDAIAVAQTGWKILVVYIAGENEDSVKMAQSTWQDPKVIQWLSQQCVVLHLLEGSKDAIHFSALYPFSSIPTVTFVGHNGVLLRQHEGYITPEDFLDILQQTTLYLQNVAASAMIAALSSSTMSLPMHNTSESCLIPNHTTGPSNEVSLQKFSTSNTSSIKVSPASDTSPPKSEFDGKMSTGCSSLADSLNTAGLLEHNSSVDTVFEIERDEGLQNNLAESEATTGLASCSEIENMSSTIAGRTDAVHNESIDCGIALQSEKPATKAESVFLQIRLTNGESIRGQFAVQDSLKVVRDFVDENRTDGNCGYLLAVPYPRKVFNDQDVMRTLLELKIEARAALIVVPKQSLLLDSERTVFTTDDHMASNLNASKASGSFLWKTLSFFNPFSYWGRSRGASSENSAWQYGPNIALGNALRDGSTLQRGMHDTISAKPLSPSSKGEAHNGRSSGPVHRNNLGSNIHTLQHDEDDISRKGNSYWNGNSTEFGGDDLKGD